MTRRLAVGIGVISACVLGFGPACTSDDDGGNDQAEAATESEGDSGDGDSGDGDGDPGDGDGDPGDGDGDSSALTYYKDAKPILDANCVTCHVEGGIGPFALQTWAQVEQWAPIIAPSIADLSMPPWPPNPSCNSYEDERLLGIDERELLLEWIDAGFPEGDPADAPPDPEPPAPFEADFSVSLPEPYTPTQVPDDYRCFVIPWPDSLTEPTYVTAQVVEPDQLQLVHHVISFVADPDDADFYIGLDEADPAPGYECFGGPGKLDWTARWLGDWVPGMDAWYAPPGSGIEVQPGSSLIVQVHYNNLNAEPVADQTTLGFQISDTVERPGTFVPVTKFEWIAGFGNMTIPAGEANVHHSATLDREHELFQYTLASLGVGPSEEVDVWRSALHMHLLGTQARLSITQDNASEDCLVQIDDWDFNWQGDYMFNEAVPFGAGDTMQLDCWYDNTEANQPIVNGEPKQPETVGWGDGTFDEMCLGIIYVARK
ncbi:monooxygenase [Enhygromyxa salina]|nr:monooxygenase [Enhygromyxa salina]